MEISPTFLSKIETGEANPPTAGKVIRMAELLGIDADELLAIAEKVDPKLTEIIREMPVAMANFLRAMRNISADKLRELTEEILECQLDLAMDFGDLSARFGSDNMLGASFFDKRSVVFDTSLDAEENLQRKGALPFHRCP